MPTDLPIPPQPADLPLPPSWIHDGVRTLPAVPYSAPFGMRAVEMDIHLPAAGSAPVPVVVYVHGGAFLFGDRRDPGPMFWEQQFNQFTALPQQGIAVASIDYRLAHEATFPAQLDDLRAAQQYLVDRADELGIDPTRIAIWGESAGAHLGMLLAYQPTPDVPPIAAVVDWFGPSDLFLPFGEMPLPPPTPEERLIGGSREEMQEAFVAASPITHVDGACPPTLVVHGTGDTVVAPVHSEHLARALTAAEVDVELVWIDGAEHAWIGSPEGAANAQAATYAFLRERLLN